MPRSLAMMVAVSVVGIFAAVVPAQDRSVPLTMQELPCTFCHTCDKPTSKYPCLRGCPRTSPRAITDKLSQKRGPDVVILDKLQDLYLPVPFDHRGHAEMAKMTTGCAACHHYTPEGTAHPACRSCHEVAPKSGDVSDMRKPTLKHAYHRQCMSCHREWSGGTGCAACHPPKEGSGQGVPTVKELLEVMPHPVPQPHTKIYEPPSKPAAGAKIIFRHKEHIDRFGIKCAECHREDSCSRCHQEGQEPKEQPGPIGHKPCAACHDVDNTVACDQCHWKEGEAKPKPFDHADTRWPLSKYHAKLGCRTCHEQVPFRKPDRNCDTCHSAWQPDTFDHTVTGQQLDEEHREIDCADCHADRKFDGPPKCDGCHEPDEGISFPARRPGPVVLPTHRVKDRPTGG